MVQSQVHPRRPWETIDGYSEGSRIILSRVSLSNMAKQAAPILLFQTYLSNIFF